MIKPLYILVFALALLSCNQREEAKANTDLTYFDLKGYFGKEILRLKKAKTKVNKTVSINGIEENKTSLINDWDKELAIFVNADINKNSWKGSFEVNKKVDVDTYTTNNKKIPIKKISVTHRFSQVSKVEIIINNKNILFQSRDTLIYVPDQLYQIKKQQKIRFLDTKNYSIIARFNP
ncbi:hypothetical protein EV200_11244 [Pedobacter psychrotolerans]|uniref:Uncharacterized protein n=1 Tax=Pedobacter psychrotolerans TaxID=1843235 RepID=A0A4R2H1L1_9SPHI|nr:hypothetical protein [Pedobacter psychrotolerans]TCO18238.1 hypothetical protein EV200_11244 [Pedobacter psychrotolerans]GGE70846.1 hypothetical protein GCM10011413_41960 [Pedobacter psychrotolerans]